MLTKSLRVYVDGSEGDRKVLLERRDSDTGLLFQHGVCAELREFYILPCPLRLFICGSPGQFCDSVFQSLLLVLFQRDMLRVPALDLGHFVQDKVTHVFC